MSHCVLGVIADDFTGATDIASMLVRAGLRVVQTIGVPSQALLAGLDADATVVALKSRSIPAADAVEQSLAAQRSLASLGVAQTYFKYCSTFDSTAQGNIGPVADALLEATAAPLVPHLPALPENGRTVFQGHLFVFDKLLHESGMQNHPLNPMTDANLVRWLARQTPRTVGSVTWQRVNAGAGEIGVALDALVAEGHGHAIGDAIADRDLAHWGEALVDYPLVAGGSGLATPLARAHAQRKRYTPVDEPLRLTGAAERPGLILAGSCSSATLAQIARFRDAGGEARRLDPRDLAARPELVEETLDWAGQRMRETPVMVYASGTREEVTAAQAELGAGEAGRIVEQALARIAGQLVGPAGAGRVIAAGGETSGAVVSALGAAALRIGPEIDPGVPWTEALDGHGEHLAWLALKSGNFGAADFFTKALRLTERA